jgi:hypothetical protein
MLLYDDENGADVFLITLNLHTLMMRMEKETQKHTHNKISLIRIY